MLTRMCPISKGDPSLFLGNPFSSKRFGLFGSAVLVAKGQTLFLRRPKGTVSLGISRKCESGTTSSGNVFSSNYTEGTVHRERKRSGRRFEKSQQPSTIIRQKRTFEATFLGAKLEAAILVRKTFADFWIGVFHLSAGRTLVM